MMAIRGIVHGILGEKKTLILIQQIVHYEK